MLQFHAPSLCLSVLAVLAAIASGGCAARQAPAAAADLALAERATDCAYAFTRHVMVEKDSGDPERLAQAERLYVAIGWWDSAARGLSSDAFVDARWAVARDRGQAQRDAIPQDYPADVRVRRYSDQLAVELLRCKQLQDQNADALWRAVNRMIPRQEVSP